MDKVQIYEKKPHPNPPRKGGLKKLIFLCAGFCITASRYYKCKSPVGTQAIAILLKSLPYRGD